MNFSGLHFTSLVPFPSSSELELVSSATGKVQELLTENLTNTFFHKRMQSDITSFKHFIYIRIFVNF